jgi:hypothetical protein
VNQSTCELQHLGGFAGTQISWCPDCGTLNLTLGYVQIKLTAAQFAQVHEVVNQAMHKVKRLQAANTEVSQPEKRKSNLH